MIAYLSQTKTFWPESIRNIDSPQFLWSAIRSWHGHCHSLSRRPVMKRISTILMAMTILAVVAAPSFAQGRGRRNSDSRSCNSRNYDSRSYDSRAYDSRSYGSQSSYDNSRAYYDYGTQYSY